MNVDNNGLVTKRKRSKTIKLQVKKDNGLQ